MPLCQSKSSIQVVDEHQELKVPTPMDGKVIKEGVFPCLSRGKDSFRLFLTTREIILQPLKKDDDRIERFGLEDLFGCHTLKHTKKIEQAAAYLCFYLYPKCYGKMSGLLSRGKFRERTPLVFLIQKPGKTFRENLEFASEWKEEALKLLRGMYPPHWEQINGTTNRRRSQGFLNGNTNGGQVSDNDSKELSDLEVAISSYQLLQRRYLVILNPKSGKGKSISIYREKVAPLLHEAGIKAELLVTQSAGHAQSFVSTNSLDGIHAVCTVGGDGLLFEVVNGLRSRQDAEHYSHLPVGVIAGGSGNGLARSLADYAGESDDYLRHPVLSTSLAVARGRVIPVNLLEADLDGKKIFSFLSVGWGLLADIDVESEVLRALGEPRFTVWSLLRLVNLKTYNAELSYIPSSSPENSTQESVRCDSDFISIFGSCQSYLGTELLFAPEAKPNDGCIHLTFSRGSVGRISATQFLLGLSDGSHLSVNGVTYVKVSEFQLQCKGGLPGNLVIDGERVSGEKLTVKLCSDPLKVFCL